VPFLSPAKILVILVVALIVLGPDKLPKMAKQLGGLWGDFRKFRERIESDVRGSFPDLPSTDTIAHAVRSPLSFLDNLADTHAAEQGTASEEASGSEPPGAPDDARPTPTGDPGSHGPPVTAAPTPDLPGISIADPGGVVHQVRASGVMVPDDPGLN
jgi:sec-independent protein translocase protein TatB